MTSPAPTSKPNLPLKEYFGATAYLGLLLGSCVVALPRSTGYFLPDTQGYAQRTSSDRPEHPFLTPLTANPTATTAWEVAGLAITMAWWGGKNVKWWGGRREQRRFVDAAKATAGTAVALTAALTLFGAPSAFWFRSFLLALHLALLTAWPLAYTLGIPSLYDDGIAARFRLTRLVCDWQPQDACERALAYPAAGAIVGAWMGALAIPLDWDRPWQAYPLTPLVGSVVGYMAGHYVSFWISALGALRSDIKQDAAANAPKPLKRRKGGKAK